MECSQGKAKQNKKFIERATNYCFQQSRRQVGSAADASVQRELVAEVQSGFVSDEGINGPRRSGTRVQWSC